MEFLSLKWNNHKTTFFDVLTKLRSKESYSDVTLACQGEFFPVHKLVLATCSNYLSEVFEHGTGKESVVVLHGIELKYLQFLLDYMYLGEVDVPQAELAGLIKAAGGLQIKGLVVPDEDPSPSDSKRSLESESLPQPKRRKKLLKKSKAASIELDSDARLVEHTSNTEQKALTLFPKVTIKLKKDDSPDSPPTDIADPLCIGDDPLEFKEEKVLGSNVIEDSMLQHADRTNLLDNRVGISPEDENPDNSPQQNESIGVEQEHLGPSTNKSQKIHICEYCTKQLQSSWHYRRHMRIHTGEKPFKCPVCARGFADRSNINKHMITHEDRYSF